MIWMCQAPMLKGCGKASIPPTTPGLLPGTMNTGKHPKEILRRLISCVARGGTYMLNIGPRGDGSIPERAARTFTCCWQVDRVLSPGRLWYRCIALATCPALGRCDGKRQHARFSAFSTGLPLAHFICQASKQKSNLHPSLMAIDLHL